LKFLIVIGRALLGLAGLATFGLCVLALAAPLHWLLALVGAWDRLVLVIGFLGLLALLVARWKVLAVLQGGAVLALLFLNFRVPTELVATQHGSQSPPALQRLVWANVHDNRAALRALASLPEVRDAGVVGLGEVPGEADLYALFPSVERIGPAAARSPTWGVETLGCRIIPAPELSIRPNRLFGLKAACPRFTLFVLHLQNPTRGRGEGLRQRDLELQTLARAVSRTEGPVVVMGDFNTTPSALPLYHLLHDADLKRVGCGGPVAGTWRPIRWARTAWDAIPGLKVTIDHILVRNVEVAACTVGPDIGSDHFPLIVTLANPR
jgi:endonuclease/exonuclease/phosphatase (EEP) superfamily protein YafD